MKKIIGAIIVVSIFAACGGIEPRLVDTFQDETIPVTQSDAGPGSVSEDTGVVDSGIEVVDAGDASVDAGSADAGEASIDAGVDAGSEDFPGKGNHYGWCKNPHNPHYDVVRCNQ